MFLTCSRDFADWTSLSTWPAPVAAGVGRLAVAGVRARIRAGVFGTGVARVTAGSKFEGREDRESDPRARQVARAHWMVGQVSVTVYLFGFTTRIPV